MIEPASHNPALPGAAQAAGAPMTLRAGTFVFTFPRPALIMGVLNITPDSFSDGGCFLDPEAAADHARALVAEGADLLDIGGESTRPNASPVSESEELRRVMPVLERLAGQIGVPLSIDTMKPAVARRALAAGASVINNVASLQPNPAMEELAAQTGAAYVLMHMRGTPQTMQANPVYSDVTAEVDRFFEERLPQLAAAGVNSEQILLDVGIGFAKTVEHNLQLLARLDRFQRHGRPLLLGVSRKSFIGAVAGGAAPGQRLPGSLACASWGVHCGAQMIRAHDVAATRQAARLAESIRQHRTPWTS